jgi:NADPH:quinone reductase
MRTRAILIERPGGPEVLRLAEQALTEPGPGEVRLRHTAIGVNFIDVQHRTGRYPLPSYPAPIGFEGAGVVEAVGPGVTSVRAGDRVVYGFPPPGSYADRRCLSAEHLVPLPDGIGDETAAALFNKGITAHYLLHATRPVAPGETILVHAAAGGVGSLLCQWAAAKGAVVIGTVGSPEKAAVAAANGCAHVVRYREEDFVARVRAITGGRGVPVVFDSVGQDTFEGSLACLAPRGLLVSFGTASGPIPPFDLFRLNTLGSLAVTSPAYVTYTRERAELLGRAAEVFAAVAAGTLRVAPPRLYPLEQAAQAHRDLQGREAAGVAVLQPA